MPFPLIRIFWSAWTPGGIYEEKKTVVFLGLQLPIQISRQNLPTTTWKLAKLGFTLIRACNEDLGVGWFGEVSQSGESQT